MDLKALIQGVAQIAEDKKIEAAKVFEAIEGALAAAYKKEYMTRGVIVKAKLDMDQGDLKFVQAKEVVDETVVKMVDPDSIETEEVAERAEGEDAPLPRYNPQRHLLLSEANKIKKEVKMGDGLEFALEAKTDFGRIAAQTAKQVIIQRIREAEREAVWNGDKGKETELI